MEKKKTKRNTMVHLPAYSYPFTFIFPCFKHNSSVLCFLHSLTQKQNNHQSIQTLYMIVYNGYNYYYVSILFVNYEEINNLHRIMKKSIRCSLEFNNNNGLKKNFYKNQINLHKDKIMRKIYT